MLSYSSLPSLAKLDAALRALTDLAQVISISKIAVGKQRNSLLPINTLPEEILIYILQLSLHDVPAWYGPHRRLAQVQYRWWRTISDCPLLWTGLHVGDPDAWTRKKMYKSGEALLSIDLGDDDMDPHRSIFLHQIRQTLPRWKSIKFRGRDIDVLEPYLNRDIPCLASLDLTYDGHTRSTILIKGGPWLRHLRLRWISPSGHPIFPNLQSLDIAYIPLTRNLISYLLQLVQSSPELQVLKFANLHDGTLADKSVSQPPATSFPHLRQLEIHDVMASIALPLLRMIRLDALDVLRVTYAWGDEQGDLLLSTLLGSNGGSPSILSLACSNAHSGTIRLRGQLVELKAVDARSSETVSLRITGPRVLSVLRDSGFDFPFAGPAFKGNLHFAYIGFDILPTNQFVTHFLRLLTCITSISIGGDSEGGLEVVQCLSQKDEAGGWTCPRLEEVQVLQLHNDHVLADAESWQVVVPKLVEMIERRRTAGIVPV